VVLEANALGTRKIELIKIQPTLLSILTLPNGDVPLRGSMPTEEYNPEVRLSSVM
jgi:hypothetical protein